MLGSNQASASVLAFPSPEKQSKPPANHCVFQIVESKERFPHLHNLDGGCEVISKSNKTGKLQLSPAEKSGGSSLPLLANRSAC
jgi:hypothetical protein